MKLKLYKISPHNEKRGFLIAKYHFTRGGWIFTPPRGISVKNNVGTRRVNLELNYNVAPKPMLDSDLAYAFDQRAWLSWFNFSKSSKWKNSGKTSLCKFYKNHSYSSLVKFEHKSIKGWLLFWKSYLYQ